MTEPRDERGDDQRRPLETIVLVVFGLLLALSIGWAVVHDSGEGSGRNSHYEGGGDDWGAAQFPEEFEPREDE
jgi:hypothetical protein